MVSGTRSTLGSAEIGVPHPRETVLDVSAPPDEDSKSGFVSPENVGVDPHVVLSRREERSDEAR